MTTLTMQDEKRLEVIRRVFRGELTVLQAALVIGLSERQCYRIKARVGKAGAKGVVHGNRGRPYKRKTKEKTIKQVLALARGKYQGFNDHHLSEKLKEQEKIELSRERRPPYSSCKRDRFPQEAPRDQTPKPQRKTGQ